MAVIIEKDRKSFEVVERESSWLVIFDRGKLQAYYDVDKSLCATYKDLEHFVKTDKCFENAAR